MDPYSALVSDESRLTPGQEQVRRQVRCRLAPGSKPGRGFGPSSVFTNMGDHMCVRSGILTLRFDGSVSRPKVRPGLVSADLLRHHSLRPHCWGGSDRCCVGLDLVRAQFSIFLARFHRGRSGFGTFGGVPQIWSGSTEFAWFLPSLGLVLPNSGGFFFGLDVGWAGPFRLLVRPCFFSVPPGSVWFRAFWGSVRPCLGWFDESLGRLDQCFARFSWILAGFGQKCSPSRPNDGTTSTSWAGLDLFLRMALSEAAQTTYQISTARTARSHWPRMQHADGLDIAD